MFERCSFLIIGKGNADDFVMLMGGECHGDVVCLQGFVEVSSSYSGRRRLSSQ